MKMFKFRFMKKLSLDGTYIIEVTLWSDGQVELRNLTYPDEGVDLTIDQLRKIDTIYKSVIGEIGDMFAMCPRCKRIMDDNVEMNILCVEKRCERAEP